MIEALGRATIPISKSFLIRGLTNMITIEKAEYLSFLEQNGLLELLIDTIKP